MIDLHAKPTEIQPTLKERNGKMPKVSSFISHHSSLQREQRFTLIELLVNDTCFTGDTAQFFKVGEMREER